MLDKIFNELINKIQTPEIQDKFKNIIILPIIKQIMNEIIPIIIKVSLLFCIIIILLIFIIYKQYSINKFIMI